MPSIAGARIGAHHLLHQKPNGILAVDRSSDQRVHAYLTGTLRGLQCNRCRWAGWRIMFMSLVAFPEPRRSRSWSRASKTSSTMTVKAKRSQPFQLGRAATGLSRLANRAKESVIASIASQEIHHRKMDVSKRVFVPFSRSTEFRSMSVMCGIDQNQTLGPFRAQSFDGLRTRG